MSINDHDLGEVVELVNETGQAEAEEIIEIADDQGLDLETTKEVKELADDLGLDIDDATELHDAL